MTFELKGLAVGMRLQTRTCISLARSGMALPGGQTSKCPFQSKVVFEFINKLTCPGLEAVLEGFSPSIIF